MWFGGEGREQHVLGEKRTVVVGVANPRTAEHLVAIGAALARAREARLVAVSIVVVPMGQSLSTAARQARAQRRLLRRVARAIEATGLSAETLVRAGYDVDEALAEVILELDAALLVVGRSPIPRFGQVTDSALWRLSENPPCDLITVGAHARSGIPGRILLPVRGGRHADLAAELAVGLARTWGASVTVLGVLPDYVPDADLDAETRAFRDQWEARYPGVVEARTLRAPHVLECLLREAASYDLLLMGAAASGRSFPYPFGRLAHLMAERAACPVLVAKTERPMDIDELGTWSTMAMPDGQPEAGDVSTVVDKWFAENTFHSKEFASLGELVRLKEQQGLRISLVLPTLNEEETIGTIIACMQENLQRRFPLLDEMLVIDSRSQDRTAAIARSYGVPVYVHQDLLPHLGSFHGKGEALWKSMSVATGDILAWIDTDIANIHPKFVYGLLGPLLKDARIGYVKGFYRRPLRQGDILQEASGGRVTELTARPLINLFYPSLSGLIQPLSGEYAGRRQILEQIPFSTGYGVEIGMLIDILDRFGLNAIGQVDLEQRIHRNQSLGALSRMSFTILQTVLRRLESQRQVELVAPVNRSMKVIVQTREHLHLEVREVQEIDRPPFAEVRALGAVGSAGR